MQALHWDGARLELREDYPEPSPGAGEALVGVRLAGICSTDLQIFRGYMGFTGIPGHEMVGEVLEGPAELVGQRVVPEINFACGGCAWCGRGLGRHCPTRRVLGILKADGAFAQRVAIPVANLHPVPEGLPDEAAVFAEPLAAAFEILEQVHLQPGAEALVLGDGKLGSLCAQVLHAHGARTTLAGRHLGKLALAAARGVTTLLADELPEVADFELVVEATGSAAGLAAAMQAVRPRGTLVLKSTVAAEHQASLAPLVINEVTVVGSRCGPFAPALTALAQERIAVEPMVDSTFPLSEGPAAVERARERDVLKVLLRP